MSVNIYVLASEWFPLRDRVRSEAKPFRFLGFFPVLFSPRFIPVKLEV
jgi:hypothetical protein